jgi:hypothetical protein
VHPLTLWQHKSCGRGMVPGLRRHGYGATHGMHVSRSLRLCRRGGRVLGAEGRPAGACTLNQLCTNPYSTMHVTPFLFLWPQAAVDWAQGHEALHLPHPLPPPEEAALRGAAGWQ